jgi:hypothetical protein
MDNNANQVMKKMLQKITDSVVSNRKYSSLDKVEIFLKVPLVLDANWFRNSKWKLRKNLKGFLTKVFVLQTLFSLKINHSKEPPNVEDILSETFS